jgi:hypothetical protein
MAELCAFLLVGGILCNHGLGPEFRAKLISIPVRYFMEFHDEFIERMRVGRTNCPGGCDARRLADIDKKEWNECLWLKDPIPKNRLNIFNCYYFFLFQFGL